VPAKTADVVPLDPQPRVIAEPGSIRPRVRCPWYLFASPAAIDTIEYAYLEGQDGVFIETRNGFDVDGVEIKARLDFGAKAIDWRGLYKNPGIAILGQPETAAHDSDCIAEGDIGFGVPARLTRPGCGLRHQVVGPQRDQGDQAEQGRRGAGDCLVRPLTLGLQAEVDARFLEGDLQPPAQHEPLQDLHRLAPRIRTQECLGLKPSGGIAHQNPADRDDRQTAVIPNRGSGRDVNRALSLAVPILHAHPPPGRLRVRQPLGQQFSLWVRRAGVGG
jgi:hypothetical protein